MAQKETSSDSSNKYLAIFEKKIRAQKKKLTSIEETEKKMAEGVKVNDEQQQKVGTKKSVAKTLKEFEKLRDQFVEAHKEESKKIAKTIQDKEEERMKQIRSMVALFQTITFFENHTYAKSRVGETGLTPEDIGHLHTLIGLVSGSQAKVSNNLDQALLHASKYLSQSDEELIPGLTYRSLAVKIDAATTKEISSEAPPPPQPEPKKEEVVETPAAPVETREEVATEGTPREGEAKESEGEKEGTEKETDGAAEGAGRGRRDGRKGPSRGRRGGNRGGSRGGERTGGEGGERPEGGRRERTGGDKGGDRRFNGERSGGYRRGPRGGAEGGRGGFGGGEGGRGRGPREGGRGPRGGEGGRPNPTKNAEKKKEKKKKRLMERNNPKKKTKQKPIPQEKK